jgi:hypothetical protein
VLRLLAALLAIVFAIAFAVGLALMLGAVDLASCSDPEAIAASGEDDCIEGSEAARLFGLLLGFGAVLAAAATAAFAVIYARSARGGGRTAAAAVATPVLALGALLLLPVSF